MQIRDRSWASSSIRRQSVTSVMRRISANSMDAKADTDIMQFDLPNGLKPVPGTLTAPVLGEYHPTAAQYTDESGNAYQWHARWHRYVHVSKAWALSQRTVWHLAQHEAHVCRQLSPGT
jgi:hypothetical protein